MRAALSPAAAVLLLAAAMATAGRVAGEDADAAGGAAGAIGDAIAAPLSEKKGHAARGKRIVMDREVGNCLICHRVPDTNAPFQGDLGPDLKGVGRRLSPGQIRLRLVDQSRLNPATLMPPYHRTAGLSRVAAKYRGRPVLTAQEIEDVVAYLTTLTE